MLKGLGTCCDRTVSQHQTVPSRRRYYIMTCCRIQRRYWSWLS